jgi:hypothetical protein
MKTLYTLILLATAQIVFAQPFTIKSYNIGAPGGRSSANGHTLTGAAGQYDALDYGSRVSSIAIAGGFWRIAATPRGPALRIIPAGRNIIVAWPDPSTGFQLQQTGHLNPPLWTDVRITPRIVGAENQVVLPLQSLPQFFRLRKDTP